MVTPLDLSRPDPAATPSIDTVIVNYNAGPLLVEAVTSSLAEGASRIFVVDNQSSDRSLQYLQEQVQDPRVEIIRNPRNLGFAAACNRGIQASTADFILFLNPDGKIGEGAVRRMLDVMQSDGSIGMVGGLLCNPDGTEQPGGRRAIPTPRTALIRALGLSRFQRWFPVLLDDHMMHQKPLPPAPIPVEAISGACMLVRRSAVATVGMMDEGYFLHCEDLDWCMRFRQGGFQIFFTPEARITHIRGACSKSRPFFVEWHKHRGMARFYRKFIKQRYPWFLNLMVLAGIWTRFSMACVLVAARVRAGS